MTTSKQNGFFTASFLILLICLSIAGQALSFIQNQNLTENCISYYDRQYLSVKRELEEMELRLKRDPRFPDYNTFMSYVTQYPKETYALNSVRLEFLSTIADPDGFFLNRFSLYITVNGVSVGRPVLAHENPDGSFALELAGIAN